MDSQQGMDGWKDQAKVVRVEAWTEECQMEAGMEQMDQQEDNQGPLCEEKR
jgi:hypothetical protein